MRRINIHRLKLNRTTVYSPWFAKTRTSCKSFRLDQNARDSWAKSRHITAALYTCPIVSVFSHSKFAKPIVLSWYFRKFETRSRRNNRQSNITLYDTICTLQQGISYKVQRRNPNTCCTQSFFESRESFIRLAKQINQCGPRSICCQLFTDSTFVHLNASTVSSSARRRFVSGAQSASLPRISSRHLTF